MKTITKFSILIFFLTMTFACKKDDVVVVPKSSAKEISTFSISGVAGTIDATARTIKASVPAGTDATKLAPTITISDKATVSPASGVSQDFTKSVNYTVTAEDGTTQIFAVSVTVLKYEYEIAIEAKYKALGWDKDGHSPFNGSAPVKTKAGKGYVQYYAFGSRKTAIYYYEGKGAFAMDTEEMIAYDNVGQDTWGFVVSDPKPTLTGACLYNDIIIAVDGKEAIIYCQNLVYGNIYQKYKDLKRWDGPLGLPTSSETPGANSYTDKGRFSLFQNGLIVFRADIGTQAIWGRSYKLWAATDFERGWLRFPTTSCDPTRTDIQQVIKYQGGTVDAASCGSYFTTNGLILYQNGTFPAKGVTPPCY